ncbi:pentatricopeptide repeat-containing protein At1g09900-like [Prosopis cineraria]|uniref:pentatricopeptide repeat-containing protein At1g09900-like n=1 Tax=Prosopis cineraria TaxID=364024 RepID=UPI00240FF6F7|nr:pentatricopeptide repeat-containing protein At1g09900-like [Prosopis cineraria]XP_054783716.1 pentatricopeptide repeat-containing protein At1g09900-like [Prosopis cineraria]XP_054783717.1 pentatricopeptide repeat-containing protein At1g09900-like [Prosopis cineraria]XP_054783718.1 pentatricopeptide repeat-containing protein At1g09900-like [Prosopis cineraria]XP_054783719.1 pentatricopeptide repeat-containing protein At1g09900-like [Prosopis cineraria]XP_054783720.1 pentatricopeptide repeat-
MPVLTFGTITSVSNLYRLCRNGSVLVNFSSLCALKTMDLTDASEAHDCNYIELQHIMQNYATSGYFEKAMETLRCMRNIEGKPTVYDYNGLIYCYLRSHNVSTDKLEQLYQGMKRFGPVPNALTFNTLLNGLLSLSNLKTAFLIVKEMHSSGFVPSFSLLSRMLKKLIYSGHFIDSLNMFDFVMRLKYCPTHHTVDSLVSMLANAGLIQKAYFVLSTLLEEGYFCGTHNYNKILWAMCKSNQSYAALQLLYLMKKKGIIPSVCSYTALVYGFCKEGWCEEDLLHCLDDMESDGCKPNVKTYTIIIKFLCDNGRIGQALEYLAKMQSRGCEPDLTTYNVILRELCHQDREDDVVEILQVINQKGYLPNPHTCAALSGGLLKIGKSGVAFEILRCVISKGCALDIAVLNILFHCLCLEGRLQEMISLLKIMMEGGFSPNNVSYNTILKAFAQENLEEAFKLLDCFEWGANKPDSISFNTILCAACKQENSPIIGRVLYRMECEGIKPNAIGTSCLIQYFCKVGRFSACLELLELMLRDGFYPAVTFNVVLGQLCKNGSLKTACDFLDVFRTLVFHLILFHITFLYMLQLENAISCF